MQTTTCQCGRVHRYHAAAKCVPCPCGEIIQGCETPIVSESDPPGQWPLWALLIGKMRHDGETGVGDTAHRIITRFGGAYWSTLVAAFGVECGCTDRQHEWNVRYPY